MCGIAGNFAYQQSAPPVQLEELRAIQHAMYSRGPDDSGEWISADDRLGFVHRRLAVLDLSECGKQPMRSIESGVTTVYNGEIYNFRELRRELEQAGHSFRTETDTEVLLYLYEEHGIEMVHRLRGMYAFALWDPKAYTLYLVRDPYGIKPLYYSDINGSLRFASSVRALQRSEEISLEPDPAGHVGFFLLGSVPEPRTLYRDILQLPAGGILSLRRNSTPQLSSFCSVSEILVSTSNKPEEANSPNESRQILKEALTGSVKHHLISDAPLGFFLSAGIDSNVLVSLAREAGHGQVHTITLGFEPFRGTEKDETPLAEQSASQLQTTHQTCWIGEEDFSSSLHHFFESMDQPSIDAINTYFVSKVAKESGLTVALSGIGGDELFGGYPSFSQIPKSVSYLRHFPSSLGSFFRAIAAPIVKHFTSAKWAGVLEYGGSYSGAYLLRRGLFMPWELPEVLDPELVRDGWPTVEQLLLKEPISSRIEGPFNAVQQLEMAWYMRNQLLRDADWASMAFSLEIRVPLVDGELHRTVAELNAGQGHLTKQDLYSCAGSTLPDQIGQRAKTGFQVPIDYWLKSIDPHARIERGLRSWAREVYRNLSSQGVL